MSNAIKHEHDAFGAYGICNDWAFDDARAVVEVYINNGRERGYVSLSLEEAAQAIDLIKDAIKQAEKEVKQAEKNRVKREKRSGRERF